MDDRRPRELADLASVEDPVLDQLPDGTALSTFGTYSTASTTSCPVSSAGSAMTAS